MSSRISDYPIKPIPFTKVKIDDGFWKPRIDTAINVTIPYDFQKCEETGRIDNFAKAGGCWQARIKASFTTTRMSSKSWKAPPTPCS